MPTAVSATVSELPDSRVRVEVHVEPQEIEARLEREARQLGQRLKMPGFRRGKVPPPIVIQRMGRDAVFEEAVRSSIGGWYASAVESAGIVPVGDPSVTLGEAPPQGEAFEFSIEVGVLPRAELGDYKGLEVPRPEASVPEQAVDEEIERLRDRLAKLEDVEGAAERGDFVVIDYSASTDGQPMPEGQGRDQLVELGNGRLLPDLESGLVGAKAGDERTIDVAFPADYPNEEFAGRTASFEVTVKQVKRKQLLELDEDFAADTVFDSIAELREDIAQRLRSVEEERIGREFREAALDEAASHAKVSVPQALIEARAKEMWERTLRALARQGVSREAYLKITARREDELLKELAPAAEQALRREAVITAVVQAEHITADDEELLEALRGHDHHDHDHHDHDHDHGHGHDHDHEGEPERLMAELRRSGRLEELREELSARKAIDFIVSEAKPIARERAAAREKLWTPEKELERAAAEGRGGAESPQDEPAGEQRIWTPGSSG